MPIAKAARTRRTASDDHVEVMAAGHHRTRRHGEAMGAAGRARDAVRLRCRPPMADKLAEIAKEHGTGGLRRHIFLCCDQTKPKCCAKDEGLESWQFLKS